MTTYRISRAADEDLDVLSELHRATFTAGESLPDFEEGHWWLAYKGFNPVGFGGLHVEETKKDDHPQAVGYLCRAGVVDGHRGCGLQLRLIRVRERKARELGLSWVVTDTNDNAASANNLIKAGYKLYHPKHPWALKSSLYWRKEIQ